MLHAMLCVPDCHILSLSLCLLVTIQLLYFEVFTRHWIMEYVFSKNTVSDIDIRIG